MKMNEFCLGFHWSLFLRFELTLVQIMAWRRPGDKPLSEPMMVSLLTQICVTRPQWVMLGSVFCCGVLPQYFTFVREFYVSLPALGQLYEISNGNEGIQRGTDKQVSIHPPGDVDGTKQDNAKQNTVKHCYNTVQYNMISHTSLRWL